MDELVGLLLEMTSFLRFSSYVIMLTGKTCCVQIRVLRFSTGFFLSEVLSLDVETRKSNTT